MNMRLPGIEPGSLAWEAKMLTATQKALSLILRKKTYHLLKMFHSFSTQLL